MKAIVVKQLEKVAITLRTSISISDNDWAAMLYDGENDCFSKSYLLHIVDRVGDGLIYALLSGKTSRQGATSPAERKDTN